MLELFAFIFLVGLVTVAAVLIYAVMVYSQSITDILDTFHRDMLELQGRLNTAHKENQDGTERRTAETTQQEDKHHH